MYPFDFSCIMACRFEIYEYRNGSDTELLSDLPMEEITGNVITELLIE